MLSTQAEYYSFLVVVFFAFWLARRNRGATMAVVLTANLLFYSHWGFLYLILIPGCATVDFFLARGIARTHSRWLVALSVAMNLGLIVTSRYVAALSFLLPLGLSFYAFQALTYTLEIYREEAQPTKSFIDYLVSVTFFPTVVAGPITRVPALIPQWRWKGTILSPAEGGRALGLISLGLLKKFLIADYLANNLVNRVFDLPKLYASGDVLVAVYSYAFQLYYDFSGYSDIAIGSALLLGVRLPENFNQPYRAVNVADFWRRWHISFSNWLRDNIYYSLPGKRTKWMPVLGLVITMALGGIWHGVAWTFLIWGLWHGIGLAVVRLWQIQRRPATHHSIRQWKRIGAAVLTFHFVLVGWVFFRAASVEAALQIFGRIGTLRLAPEAVSAAYFGVLALAAAAHYLPNVWRDQTLSWFSARPALLQAAALILTAVAIRYTAGAGGAAPFIYSRF
jgi:D-alanyl-lipoteichoic acid acyltransferase DltB (MBOAT superfamily)